ncbi:MAG TPA: chemotaxis protein CheB, partial [Polyangiaceae bacterium]|nr:chemotaxis protein CheB [Polyangiaceae bacterium]
MNHRLSPARHREDGSEVGPVPALPMFIVGVGASAGGLEALESLFGHVRPNLGISYVVVQHLSPDFKSMMVELLGRHTKLRVVEIEDGSSPQQNCIHLVGPKSLVALRDGVFRLMERDGTRLPFPINLFLTSLAEQQGDQCAAVILSGTGTDGTHGSRVIKE